VPKRERIPLSAEFEKLVATIVGELESTAVVTWNDHILGKRSGRKRQIDVSIRRTDPQLLGIIDAKHYARAATIDRIDALTGLMRDVGANYGALVCSAGFSRTIFNYARSVGVSLFNVHDAESVNWSKELEIPVLWTELTPVVRLVGTFELMGGDTIDTNDPLGVRVTTDGGLTVLDPLASFETYWNGPNAPRTTGVEHQFNPDRAVQAVVHDEAGNRVLRPARNFGLRYTVEAKTWLGRFQPSECRGLIDYLDDEAFTVSYLPPEQLPVQRDEEWQLIERPDRLGVIPRGTAFVSLTPLAISDTRFEQLQINYVGPLPAGSAR
jgi:hypothetical protein